MGLGVLSIFALTGISVEKSTVDLLNTNMIL